MTSPSPAQPVRALSGLDLGRRVVITQPHHPDLPEPGVTRWRGAITRVEHHPERTWVDLDSNAVLLAEPERCTVEDVQPHHVEAFREDTAPADPYGWQCFTPSCRQEQTGFPTFAAAEEAADQHRHESET